MAEINSVWSGSELLVESSDSRRINWESDEFFFRDIKLVNLENFLKLLDVDLHWASIFESTKIFKKVAPASHAKLSFYLFWHSIQSQIVSFQLRFHLLNKQSLLDQEKTFAIIWKRATHPTPELFASRSFSILKASSMSPPPKAVKSFCRDLLPSSLTSFLVCGRVQN